MKTMIRFIAVLLTVFVAECQISALDFIKGPAVLPYGKNFPGSGTVISVYIDADDGNPDPNVVRMAYGRKIYDSTTETLEEVVRGYVTELASNLDGVGPNPEMWNVSIDVVVDTGKGGAYETETF